MPIKVLHTDCLLSKNTAFLRANKAYYKHSDILLQCNEFKEGWAASQHYKPLQLIKAQRSLIYQSFLGTVNEAYTLNKSNKSHL